MDSIKQFSNSFWFNNPAISSAYVDWAKTQPGYENWDGTPIPLTLEEDRKLIRDLNSWAPDPAQYSFKYAGVTPEQFLVPVQTSIAQRDALLKYIDDNPSMTSAQLTPGMDAIKAYYKPILTAQNQSVSNAVNAGLDKDLNPGGFWKALDAGTQMLASAALSVGGGAMLGGVLGGLGVTPDISNILSKGIIGGATSGSLQGAATGALGGVTGNSISNIIGGADSTTSGLLSGLGDTTADIIAGTAGTGAAAGGSMDWSDLLSGLGDTTSDLGGMFGDVLGGSQASGWDYGPLSDALMSGATDPSSGLSLTQMLGSAPSGWDFGPLSDSLLSGGVDPVSGMTLNQMQPGLLDLAKNYIKNNPGSSLKTAVSAISGLLSSAGGVLSGNAAQGAAKTTADAQIEAARIAADAAKFRPVGVTTRFGQSNFTKDAQGNVTNAGYTMPTDIRAMQDSLLGAAPGMLGQFTGSQAATAPMGVGAQRAMSLGNQYLNTDPQAQAQKYYNDQQAIMAAGRARDQAGALTGEFNRGTYGLATGATGMMGAANPRLEAMYNAQRQQDLQASANATQGGMDYTKFGAGLVGTGGNMLRDMYGTQSASYSPFGTALTGAQNIEGLGQNALDMSINIGKTASPAQSGQLLANGMLGASQTMQQANQYSPWGTALMNAGNAMGTYQNQQAQQQAQQQQQNQFLALLTGYKNGTPV